MSAPESPANLDIQAMAKSASAEFDLATEDQRDWFAYGFRYGARWAIGFRAIGKEDLDARITKLRTEAPVINSLLVHFGQDFETMISDFSKRNPHLKADVLKRMKMREVTIYVDDSDYKERA